jgi:hypothetical protein
MKDLRKKQRRSFESQTLAFSPAKRQITHAMGWSKDFVPLQEIPLRQVSAAGIP